MYIKLINGQPTVYTIDQLRQDYSNISFPRVISNEILEKFDVYPYTLQDFPTYNEKTQKIEEGTFVEQNNTWIKSWNIVNKTQEEIDMWLVSKSNEIRTQRNFLLLETDYLALSDNTLTSEMAAYRQSLRDITLQEGFPENVIWPIKPN